MSTVKTKIRVTATSKTKAKALLEHEDGALYSVEEQLIGKAIVGATHGGRSKGSIKEQTRQQVADMIREIMRGYDMSHRNEMADSIVATITSTPGKGASLSVSTDHPTLVMKETGETVEGKDYIEAKNAKVMRIPVERLFYQPISADEYLNRMAFGAQIAGLEDFNGSAMPLSYGQELREKRLLKQGKIREDQRGQALYRKRVAVGQKPWADAAGYIAVRNLSAGIVEAIDRALRGFA